MLFLRLYFYGNFAVGCRPGTDYPTMRIFQYMLERTDAIKNEVLEPITFFLAHPNVLASSYLSIQLSFRPPYFRPHGTTPLPQDGFP